MPSTFRLTVNGVAHEVAADPATPLLYILRNDLGLNAPKFGCGLEECGACTVIIGSAARRCCCFPVSAVGDAPVTTLEGLGTVENPHPLQKAFMERQAAQCGYCTSGMIMQAKVFLDKNRRPNGDEIRQAMQANLCRCGTHVRILAAISDVAKGGST